MEGNQMKMREARDAINSVNTGGLKRLLVELVESDIFDGGLINKTISAVEKARRALAAPPRQCDIGTAEEQAERQKAYCRKHFTPDQLGGNCRKCPLKDRRGWSCQLAWAQMPYAEEGGAK